MRAAIMPEPGKIEMIDVTLPEMQEDEVLIDVKAVGICTFEQGYYYGKSQGFPFAGGHEICGVVEKAGSKVAQKLKPGDKVIVLSLTRCGECYYCRKGYDNQCENAKDVQKIPGVDGPGGFADKFIAKGYEVFKIDESVPFERGILGRTSGLCDTQHEYVWNRKRRLCADLRRRCHGGDPYPSGKAQGCKGDRKRTV